jgi:hypothetical protein
VKEGCAGPNDRHRDKTITQAPEGLAGVAARAVDEARFLEVREAFERQDLKAKEPRAKLADRRSRARSSEKLHENDLGHRNVLLVLDELTKRYRDFAVGPP